MYAIDIKKHTYASPRQLLRIWRNPQVLLKSATSIKKFEVLKRDKNNTFTAWDVDVDKVLIKWNQQDSLDIKNGLINFKICDGEFNGYDGVWSIKSVSRKIVELSVHVNIDWGIPILAPYVEKMLQKKTYRIFLNFINIIDQISHDER